MNIKDLLKTRARIKSKKPSFLVQDAHKRKELPAKWRKPRGVDSKMRLGKKGHRKKPSQGYRSPKLVKGLHRTGLKLVRVCSLKELENLPKESGVIISSKVGQKKRFEIIKRTQQLKIKVINVKVDEFLKKLEEKKKKVEKEVVEKKKEPKKKEKEEKIKEKKVEKKEEKDLTEKERKDAEKKKKDKLLTKRTK